MVTAAKIRFYDRVWISSTTLPTGSAGTYKYMEAFTDRVIEEAKQIAPIGNDGDRYPKDRGRSASQRYIGHFKKTSIGTNVVLRRQVFNDSDHAYYVENGRKSTIYKRFEVFYSNYNRYRGRRFSKAYGDYVWGTRGWDGYNVLSRALALASALIGSGVYSKGFTRAVDDASKVLP